MDLESRKVDLLPLLLKLKAELKQVEAKTDEEAVRIFINLTPDLMKFGKCPDYIVNKGHYFGTSFLRDETPLSDDDKRALIEFLKTF
jgi:hypothetical protein